ncbi:MAG: hypothetical protein QF432_02250 [Dehalococcoidales bacterium]|nr:hypothetical protein [Dehalococcoidales bacterium]
MGRSTLISAILPLAIAMSAASSACVWARASVAAGWGSATAGSTSSVIDASASVLAVSKAASAASALASLCLTRVVGLPSASRVASSSLSSATES